MQTIYHFSYNFRPGALSLGQNGLTVEVFHGVAGWQGGRVLAGWQGWQGFGRVFGRVLAGWQGFGRGGQGAVGLSGGSGKTEFQKHNVLYSDEF